MTSSGRKQEQQWEKEEEDDNRPPGKTELAEELFHENSMASLDDYLKQLDAMAEETRFTILYLLDRKGELSFSEIGSYVDRESNGLDHHLRTLLRAGLVEKDKRKTDGRKQSFYELTVFGEDLVGPLLTVMREEKEAAEKY